MPLDSDTEDIKYLGCRPRSDKENPLRKILCNLVGNVGCFHEICTEKLYLVNLAEGEHASTIQNEVQNDPSCPFIIWTTYDLPAMIYEPFNADFGPLNLAVTHQFCSRLKIWFDTMHLRPHQKSVVVVLEDIDRHTALNVTVCVAIAAMVLLNKSDEEVIQTLAFGMKHNRKVGEKGKEISFQQRKNFSDVSGYMSILKITVEDCIRAFYSAMRLGFYDYSTFDPGEYMFYETVGSGDLNWIVPGKLLAFAGPCSRGKSAYTKHTPEFYYHYFKDHNVTDIIRLSDPEYQASEFNQLGFKHRDLIFPDGYPPTTAIASKFIRIVDDAEGAVAIHCLAGIGRTGTLIATYLMARYAFSAHKAVAWTRICRPGSVIREQQDWLLTTFDTCTINKTPLKTKIKRPKRNSCKGDSSLTKTLETTTISNPLSGNANQRSYEAVARSYGQATALMMAKRQRELHDKRTTLNSVVTDRRLTKAKGKKDSSKSSDEGPILDLGKTLPMMFRADDLKAGQRPSVYHFQDGDNEWKIKFPETDYVKVIYSQDPSDLSHETPTSYLVSDYSFVYEEDEPTILTHLDGRSIPKLVPMVIIGHK